MPLLISATFADVSGGHRSGPRNEIRIIRMTMMKPKSPILLRLRILNVLTLSRQKLSIKSTGICILIIASYKTNARIEPAIYIISQQIGKDDRDCNDQEDTLHHRVVALRDRTCE